MAYVEQPLGVLVCVPAAIPAAERAQHIALASELLNRRMVEWIDWADGFGFRFAPDSLPELSRFIDKERKCCPFNAFELLVAPLSGPIWLRMTGAGGYSCRSASGVEPYRGLRMRKMKANG